jgi:hypothetical protein
LRAYEAHSMPVDCKQLVQGTWAAWFQIQYGQNNEGTWWIAGLKQKDEIGGVWQGGVQLQVFGSCPFGQIYRQRSTRLGLDRQ